MPGCAIARIRDVQAHIEDENHYAESRLAPVRALRERIYQEMLNRVDLHHVSVPVRHGSYEYYSRNLEDKSYAVHCRRRLQPGALEEIILDENVLADGTNYFALEFLRVSPDHAWCVFGIDTTGDERLSVFVKELARDTTTLLPVPGAIADAAWANDNETFLAVRLDDRNRPFALVRHRLGSASGSQRSISEEVIFEERDDAFRLRLTRTESGQFLILTSWAHDTTEVHYLNADGPNASIRLLHRRQPGIEVYATHHGEDFYVLTNEDAPGKKIVVVPTSNPLVSTHRVFLRRASRRRY